MAWARGARQQLHGEGADPGPGIGLDLVLGIVGVEHPDQDLAGLEVAHLGIGRPLHLEHDLAGPGPASSPIAAPASW